MGNQSSSRFNRASADQHRSSSLDQHTNRDKSQQQHHRHKSDVDNSFDYSIDNKKATTGGGGGMYSNHHTREHKRHGVVSLKVVNQHAATANLRGIENHICHTITPKGWCCNTSSSSSSSSSSICVFHVITSSHLYHHRHHHHLVGSIIYGASNFNPVAIQEAIVGSDRYNDYMHVLLLMIA